MQSLLRPLCGWVVPALLIGVGASPLYGQGPRLPPPLNVSGVSVQPRRFASLTDSIPHKRTYWLEGSLIGAVGGVVLAELVNGLACEGPDCGADRRVLVMLVGGFVVGALIGGGIEKKS